MSIDLYRVLEVPKNATKEEIKAKHRALAKKYHPDKAGSEAVEQFKLIQTAFEVLTDDKRRARYDETGSFDGHQVDRSEEGVYTLLGKRLGDLIIALIQGGGDPEKCDLLSMLKEKVTTEIKELQASLTKGEATITKLKGIAERFSSKKDSILKELTLGPVRRIQDDLARLRTILTALETGLEVIKATKYKFDKADSRDTRTSASSFVLGKTVFHFNQPWTTQ